MSNRIAKDPARLSPRPHLLDYDATCAAFSWEAAQARLDGLPGGQGLNMAYEAVDRHLVHGRAGKTAIRWLGKSGARRQLTYRKLAGASNRFANALERLGVQPGERPPAQRLLAAVLLLKATARALAQVPQLNGCYEGGVFRPGAGIQITPSTLSAPRSPRLVTVTVGSLISELRSPPLRARCTRSRSSAMSWASGLRSASCSAGATRPPPRSAMAQPTWRPGPATTRGAVRTSP